MEKFKDIEKILSNEIETMHPYEGVPYKGEEFIKWCVEKRGKKLATAKRYVHGLKMTYEHGWNDKLVGLFFSVFEAYECPETELYIYVASQIAARLELENQIDVLSWYAETADEESDFSRATYLRWHTALKEYCLFLEYLTADIMMKNGIGGDKDTGLRPDDHEFIRFERDVKQEALRFCYIPWRKNGKLTDEQLDKFAIEPFVKMHANQLSQLSSPKIYFPLASEFKKWLKSHSMSDKTRYAYASALNSVYHSFFRYDDDWNRLPSMLAVVELPRINSLCNRISMRIGEEGKSDTSKFKKSLIDSARASIPVYRSFLKTMIGKATPNDSAPQSW